METTALAVLQVFVDCQAKEEETLEQMRGAMDDVIGVGHGSTLEKTSTLMGTM